MPPTTLVMVYMCTACMHMHACVHTHTHTHTHTPQRVPPKILYHDYLCVEWKRKCEARWTPMSQFISSILCLTNGKCFSGSLLFCCPLRKWVTNKFSSQLTSLAPLTENLGYSQDCMEFLLNKLFVYHTSYSITIWNAFGICYKNLQHICPWLPTFLLWSSVTLICIVSCDWERLFISLFISI
jgi:hypothetical protein